MPLVPVGSSYTDPMGLVITRLTGALPPNDWAMLEYSTVAPISADGEFFFVLRKSYFELHSTAGYLRDLTVPGAVVSASSEPRWFKAKPSLFFFHDAPGNVLKSFDVLSNQVSVVRAFKEYSAVRVGNGEGRLSDDGDHFALVGDRADGGGTEVFVYTLSSDAKSVPLNVGPSGAIDSAYITPDNNVLVSWTANGTLRRQGMELFDSTMQFRLQAANSNGHKDVYRNPNGREELAWINSNEKPVTLGNYPNGIVIVDLQTGKQRGLLSLPWVEAVHICGAAVQQTGNLYVETYLNPAITTPLPVYANQILRLPVSGSPVSVVCNHGSEVWGYNAQPRVVVSPDGSTLLFGSNQGVQAPLYEDVYRAYLAAPAPTPTPSPVYDVQVTLADHERRIRVLEGR